MGEHFWSSRTYKTQRQSGVREREQSVLIVLRLQLPRGICLLLLLLLAHHHPPLSSFPLFLSSSLLNFPILQLPQLTFAKKARGPLCCETRIYMYELELCRALLIQMEYEYAIVVHRQKMSIFLLMLQRAYIRVSLSLFFNFWQNAFFSVLASTFWTDRRTCRKHSQSYTSERLSANDASDDVIEPLT